MGWNYTDKVKEHFMNPRNVGRIDDAQGVAEVGSISCGDALTLYLKVNEETQVIEDAKFQTFGCGSAIASSSMLTEMIKGKTIEEASKVTNQNIADLLGGLPPEKMHCSVMGHEALEAAIANYRGEDIKKEDDEDEGRVICRCFGVTENKLRKVVTENNLQTLEDVTNYTKAGGGCGACIDEIETLLEEIVGPRKKAPEPVAPQKKKITNLQRISMIQEVLDNEVRPMLQKDQGDLELMDINGTVVIIRMLGHCSGCRAAGMTTIWIQDKLQEIIDPEITIEVLEE